MRNFVGVAVVGALLMQPAYQGRAQSTDQNPATQNSQDVPHQQPGTNHPDLGQQHHPAPKPDSGDSQRQGDVPTTQKPPTNSPDMAKQKQPTPKKKKGKKSTESSTQHE